MVAAWILIPLLIVHVVVARRRPLLVFQLLVDVMLVLLVGRLLVAGGHLGPGVPGAQVWGAPRTVAGSPEQTDLPLQLGAWWDESRRLMADYQPPWVTDRIGAGTALFAHGQSGLPFPLHVPVLALGAAAGTDVMAVWKLEIAALGMFVLLLGRLRLRPAAAAAGGLAWGFGLYTLSWLVSPVGWVLAATPASLALLAGALRGRRRESAWLAVLLGVMAGWSVNPESAALLWMGVALAGTILAWGRWRRIVRLAVPFALALPVAAIGAVPTALAIHGSSKYASLAAVPIYPAADIGWELKAKVAALLLLPWREGHPADGSWLLGFPAAPVSFSVGAAAVLLAALGCRPRLRRWWLAVAATGVLGAGMAYQLPGLSQVLARVPVVGVMTWVRAGFLLSLAVAVLAALGADAWLRRPRRGRWLAASGTVAVVTTVLASTAPGPAARRHAWTTAWAPLAAVAATPAAGAVAVTALVVGEIVAAGWDVVPRSVAGRVPSHGALATVRRGAAREGGRVVGLGGALPANLAAEEGLADVRAHDPVRPLALWRLHEALGATGAGLAGPVSTPWATVAGSWGVRWLVTPPDGVTGACADGWEEIYAGADGRVYRNSRWAPVMRLVDTVVISPGDPGAGAWEKLDLEHAVVGDTAVRLGGRGRVIDTVSSASRTVATVETDGPVLAVLHVPAAPGWRTTVDDEPVARRIVDLGAMAVVVPAGRHRVAWVYTPPQLMTATTTTVIGLLACVWYGRRRSRGGGG